ncbi:MAG: hypothetical protein Q9196_004316 [Gyalolechia fulgens]
MAQKASMVRMGQDEMIVVEKLTKNVNDNHLHEIFGAYGHIKDLDMPLNKQFMANRGIAYILYSDVADAEAAIAHMHEAQLDGVIIHVSVVLPRRKFSRSPPPARRGGPTFDRFDGRGPPPGSYRSGPPPDGTGIDLALANETLIPTGPAHIPGQDRGLRGQDRSHRGRVVVLHHAVAVDTEAGNCRRLQVEEGGEGARATRAIPATVTAAVAGVEIEAGQNGSVSNDRSLKHPYDLPNPSEGE